MNSFHHVVIIVLVCSCCFLYGVGQGASMAGQMAVDRGCATVDETGRLEWKEIK